jgi:hypothetical protein
MKEILKAVLTDPSVRNADAIESLAIANTKFLSWS